VIYTAGNFHHQEARLMTEHKSISVFGTWKMQPSGFEKASSQIRMLKPQDGGNAKNNSRQEFQQWTE
jgi:hypothetical protein